MQIIDRAISTHIVNKARLTNEQAKTGAVTLITDHGKVRYELKTPYRHGTDY